MKNKIIIISSPSGAGKTTICKLLLKRLKNIQISTSYTTRPKRKVEKDGIDYFFVSTEFFFTFSVLLNSAIKYVSFLSIKIVGEDSLISKIFLIKS